MGRQEKQQSIIAYNKRNESEPLGFDKHCAPTWVREHAYRYDSYDAQYETLKYTHPKECSDCPLTQEGLCQKIFKMKITKNLRRYTAPARGSIAWKKLFNKRTVVERERLFKRILSTRQCSVSNLRTSQSPWWY